MMTATKFTPTSTQISTAKAVFMAKAYTETVRPIVEGYQQKLLNECKFTDDNGNRITESKRSYRMKNEDFKDYDNFCQSEAKKAGFNVPEGYCPLLMAENQERIAKRSLADIMVNDLNNVVPGITIEKLLHNLDNYNQFIDISLKLLVKYIK